ncbi:hypothetical protein HZB02_07355 [Candidatus Woesearchaeota archaeon]|nr:hypothetical protein [Candidatus Woesearchaeota archaeon]
MEQEEPLDYNLERSNFFKKCNNWVLVFTFGYVFGSIVGQTPPSSLESGRYISRVKHVQHGYVSPNDLNIVTQDVGNGEIEMKLIYRGKHFDWFDIPGQPVAIEAQRIDYRKTSADSQVNLIAPSPLALPLYSVDHRGNLIPYKEQALPPMH